MLKCERGHVQKIPRGLDSQGNFFAEEHHLQIIGYLLTNGWSDLFEGLCNSK